MCISPMLHSFTNHGVSFPISAPFAHLYTAALKDPSSLFTAYKLHMGISVKAAALVAVIIESILYGRYLHCARFMHC